VVSATRLVVLAVVYLPFFPLLLQRRGGFGALFLSRDDSYAAADFASGVSYGLVTVGLRVVPTMILGAALIARREGGVRRGHVDAILLVYVPIVLLVTNPISTNRYWFISAGIFIVLCAFRPSRLVRQSIVLFAVVGAVVLFPYLDYFRYRTRGVGATGVQALFTGDYDALYTTAMAVRWVGEQGVTWGYQALGVVGFWVPRGLWPGKPVDTGATVASGLGMTFTNLSSPLWAEGYVNAGVGGVLIFAVGFGLVAARLTRSRIAGFDVRSRLIWSFLVGYQLILLRGSLLQAAGQLVAVLALGFALTTRKTSEPPDHGQIGSHDLVTTADGLRSTGSRA
jgi:hypothetical protein